MLSKLLLLPRTSRQLSCSYSNYCHDQQWTNKDTYGTVAGFALGGGLLYALYETTREYDESDYDKMRIKMVNELARISKEKRNSYTEDIKKIFGRYPSVCGPTIDKIDNILKINDHKMEAYFILDMCVFRLENIARIPEAYRNQWLFNYIAVRTNSLKDIPDKYQTEDICLYIIKEIKVSYAYSDYDSSWIFYPLRDEVSYIKHPYTTVFMTALKRDYEVIKKIDPKFHTEEMWNYVLSKDTSMIKYCVNYELISPTLWKELVTNDPKMIVWCAKSSAITEELWLQALKEDPELVFQCNDPTYKMWLTAYLHNATIVKRIKNTRIKKMLEKTSYNVLVELIEGTRSIDRWIKYMDNK